MHLQPRLILKTTQTVLIIPHVPHEDGVRMSISGEIASSMSRYELGHFFVVKRIEFGDLVDLANDTFHVCL